MNAAISLGKWVECTAGEVAKIERATIQPEKIRTGTIYVGLEHITSEGQFTQVRPVEAGELASSKFAFNNEHLLYGKLRPYLKKIARPNFSGVCSTDILTILPSSKIDRSFLYYYLRQPNFIDLATARSIGANLPRLSPKTLAEFPILVPPLEEQQRIAAILDKADAVRKKRSHAIQLTEELLRATFLDMFGDPVTNSKGWEVILLGNLVTDIESGWSPNCDSREAEFHEWGILKLGSVTWGHFNPSENKALLPNTVPRPELEVKPGDLLFSRKNTYELVGASAFVHSSRPKLLIPDLIFRLRLLDTVNPVYMWQALSQETMCVELSKLASGSSGSMPNISKARLRTLRLPVPPLELQSKYHRIATVFWRKQNHLKESSELFQNLFNSLLHRAFRGEL